MKYNISLIIPAYNEEKKIEKDIREVYKFFRQEKITAEVIVSTDGVTDKTNLIVKKLQDEFSTLKLLDEKKRIGKGAAVKKGVKIAQGKYIIFADAGICVPFRFIKEGIKKIEAGSDCAFGTRAIKKSLITRPQPMYRRIGSYIFGIIVRRIIKVPDNIKDTQCGFKIYKHDVAKKLFEEQRIEGFMFDIEIILLAKKHNYKMSQFPVEWKNDDDTKFNPVTGSVRNFKDLYTIKVKYKL